MKFVGTRLFVESARVKRRRSIRLKMYTRNQRIWHFDDYGMTMTMEQVDTQLRQEVLTLKAQVADQSGLADAVRAVNNLAIAQVDVKGVGRPKKFCGKEEDFQLWPQKTKAFFASVIKESEMMLDWSAEQSSSILNSCRLRRTWSEKWMALTSNEANYIVANSRKNPLEAWWRLQKRFDSTTGGRKQNLLRTVSTLGKCSLLELQAGIERWESNVTRFEKKLKGKLDDEIKLAGLEA